MADLEKASVASKATSTPEINQDGETKPDPSLVDFDGPDDPYNPHNWSLMKKTAALSIVTVMTTLSPLASTLCAPASAEIMAYFHKDNSSLEVLVTTIFLMGYVVGPIAIAPLSEMYGRAIMYQSCMFVFTVFNMACALAPNLGALIAFRFLAGTAASCPVTLGTGSIADMITPQKRALAMTTYMLGTVAGPAVGPIIGSYLSEAAGWRWCFWFITIATGASTVLSVLFVRESYPFVLLKRKTLRLRKETGDMSLRSKLDNGMSPSELFYFSIFRPLKMLASPIVLLLSVYVAVVYSYLYIAFTSTPGVYITQYKWSSGASGLTSLGLFVGSILGTFSSLVAVELSQKYLKKRYGGESRPEYRLPVLFMGALCMPVGLFLYGWSVENDYSWVVPLVGTAFVSAGMLISFMATTLYTIDLYTTYAASVTATATISRSLGGALLPLAAPPLFNRLGYGWGGSLLGFIAVAFLPVPILFWIYGERIRKVVWFGIKF